MKHKFSLTMSKKCRKIIAKLPRCRMCNQLVHSKVDKSQPSQLIKYKGSSWSEKNPTFMPMYPSGEFPELCNYCEGKKEVKSA